MISLVDTHCHIQSINATKGERNTIKLWSKLSGVSPEQVIKNAREDNVERLICVGCDLEDSALAADFVSGRKDCFASVGIHPHEAKDYIDQTAKLDKLRLLTKKNKVIAIGECGLDYFYLHSPKDAQKEIFRYQLSLAREAKLPVIFHVRDAYEDFWSMYNAQEGVRGVLHSFTDSEQNMKKGIKAGLYIGVNGIATFTKDPKQLNMYRQIPLTRLLLETDAPYLTPSPYRGSINEPKRVRRVAEFLAQLRGEDLAKVAEATTNNAKELFGI